jgi:hypothetical protein
MTQISHRDHASERLCRWRRGTVSVVQVKKWVRGVALRWWLACLLDGTRRGPNNSKSPGFIYTLASSHTGQTTQRQTEQSPSHKGRVTVTEAGWPAPRQQATHAVFLSCMCQPLDKGSHRDEGSRLGHGGTRTCRVLSCGGDGDGGRLSLPMRLAIGRGEKR